MSSSNRTDDEDLVVRTLATLAERVAPADQWERVVEQLHDEGATPDPQRRPALAKIAASIVLVGCLVAGGFAVIRPTVPGWPFGGGGALACPESIPSAASPQDFEESGDGKYLVFGDRVIQQEPLVVEPREAPVPQFDTSDLGDQVQYNSLTPAMTAEVLDKINQPPARGSIVKVIVVGEIEGTPWVIKIADDPDDENFGGFNLRTRTVGNLTQPSSGFAEPANPDGDALLEFPMSAIAQDRSDFGSMRDDSTSWDALAPDVSVVSLETGGQKLWMRPRAGLAVFPVPVALGGTARLSAFDHLGNHIGCAHHTRG